MTELTAERAERWSRVQPHRWRPWTLSQAVVWVVLVVLATVFVPEGGCTEQEPCGSDWGGAVEVTACVAAPILLLWLKGAAVWFSGAAAALFVVVEWRLDEEPRWLVAGFPVALGLALLEGLARRSRRDRAVAELLAGVPTRRWPGRTDASLPGLSVALAVVLALAGAGVLLYGVQHGRSEHARERAAQQVSGEVVAHGDDGYLVTVRVGDVRYELDTLLADDYPVGSTQQVLLLDGGEEARLAVERYDASWSLGLALGLWLVAAALAWRFYAALAAVEALLTRPQPVHRVRVGALGHAQVLPVGGPQDVLPLVQVPVALEDPSAEDSDGEVALVQEADLYGLPVRGAVAALALADGTLLLPDGRVRAPEPAWPLVLAEGLDADDGDDDSDDDTADQGLDGPDEALDAHLPVAALTPVGSSSSTLRRLVGALVLVGAVVAAYLVARTAGGIGTALWRLGLAAVWGFDGLVRLAGAVRVTEHELVHEGPTTRRTMPWSAVRQVQALDDAVLVTLDSGDVVPLTWLPGRPLRRKRRAGWARSWAERLQQARRAAPRLGASVSVEPRPWAALAGTAFVASALFGLRAQ